MINPAKAANTRAKARSPRHFLRRTIRKRPPRRKRKRKSAKGEKRFLPKDVNKKFTSESGAIQRLSWLIIASTPNTPNTVCYTREQFDQPPGEYKNDQVFQFFFER